MSAKLASCACCGHVGTRGTSGRAKQMYRKWRSATVSATLITLQRNAATARNRRRCRRHTNMVSKKRSAVWCDLSCCRRPDRIGLRSVPDGSSTAARPQSSITISVGFDNWSRFRRKSHHGVQSCRVQSTLPQYACVS